MTNPIDPSGSRTVTVLMFLCMAVMVLVLLLFAEKEPVPDSPQPADMKSHPYYLQGWTVGYEEGKNNAMIQMGKSPEDVPDD